MRRLFLLRHGETAHNKDQIIQGGGVDSVLNQTGRGQAQQFFARYQAHPFAAVVASSLRRTQETLAPFAEAGHRVQAHPGLNEIHWGHYEGRRYDAALQAEVAHVREAWAAGDFDYPVPGGETPNQVLRRATAALEDVLAAHPEGDVLVCAHGRVNCILLSHWLERDLRNMTAYRHPNTALHLLDAQPPAYAAVKLADTSHLYEPA